MVDVRLLQVTVKTDGEVEVVEQRAVNGIIRMVMDYGRVRMVEEFPLQFRRPGVKGRYLMSEVRGKM